MDIAIQQTGDVQRLFEIARDNDKSITEDLVIGSALITPPEVVELQAVVAAFATEGHKPACGLTADDLLELKGGVDYMGIQIDLKVS